MTRKHFERIAAICKTHRLDAAVVDEFADLFAADNPRFDRERFYAAAGWR